MPEIVEAALRYVDAHGLEALTLRALGEQLGMHHTALYRYFPSRTALVAAMMDRVFGDALGKAQLDAVSVRARMLNFGLAVREALRQHPQLLSAIAASTEHSPHETQLSLLGAQLLEQAGLQGESLVRWHAVFEAYIVGACLYDFAGAPHHFTARSARYQGFDHPAFTKTAESLETVRDETEAAFRLGLSMLIDQALLSGDASRGRD